jgi:hypothetical protein
MKITRGTKFGLTFGALAIMVGYLPFAMYLNVLPAVVQNPAVIEYAEKLLNDTMGIKLTIKNPVLVTKLSPDIDFSVDNLSIIANEKNVLEVENFNTEISLKEVFSKNIIIKKLGADYIFADINKLTKLFESEEKEQQKSEWNFDFYDSILYVKKSLFLYKVEPATFVSLNADDISIDNTKKDLRFVHFNITLDIKKGADKIHFNIADRNSVYIKSKALWVDKCYLMFNKSKIFFNAKAQKNNKFNLEVFSNRIDMVDVLALINSGIVENNLNEPLAYFKDLNGNFSFNLKLSNKDLNGIVNIDNITAKIVPIANIPILLEKGKIIVTNDKITLDGFKGYYNNIKENKIEMDGTVKDYLKSIDTDIVTRAVVTNDFAKNYISKMVGMPIELTGGATRTRLDLKAINNKIDLLWLFGLRVGQDILFDGTSLTPSSYNRGLKADMHFENNLFDIKSINYYIVPDNMAREKVKQVQPVLKLTGQIDCSKDVPDVKRMGFEIPRPLPSEFLNMFVGDKLFNGGKIEGKLEYVNADKYPSIAGKMTMDEVKIPSQRVFLKHGEIKTEKGLLKLIASGGYRRSKYDFDGSLVNEIKFPIVVKDANLTVDNVDVERFLESANNQNSEAITSEKMDLTPSGVAKDDDDNTPTFDIGNFVVENCVLNIQKGVYKDISFGDLKATLTLDKNSVLDMHSNKFEIAEGHSSAKINCDLKKHKYAVRLGIKEVNADLIATTILELKKEISGKASGLIELNTDDSMKLNGSIKFKVENGTIQKIGLVEYVLKFASIFRNPVATITPSVFSDLVNIPEGNFDKINGELLLKDNVIEKMQIKSSSPQLSAYIAGRYDLENSDASLRIYTKFSNRHKGFAGALRSFSLNSLANRISVTTRNDAHYYEAELSQLPELEADEKDCQIFMTKVDGDVEHNNFISSLRKLK